MKCGNRIFRHLDNIEANDADDNRYVPANYIAVNVDVHDIRRSRAVASNHHYGHEDHLRTQCVHVIPNIYVKRLTCLINANLLHLISLKMNYTTPHRICNVLNYYYHNMNSLS